MSLCTTCQASGDRPAGLLAGRAGAASARALPAGLPNWWQTSSAGSRGRGRTKGSRREHGAGSLRVEGSRYDLSQSLAGVTIWAPEGCRRRKICKAKPAPRRVFFFPSRVGLRCVKPSRLMLAASECVVLIRWSLPPPQRGDHRTTLQGCPVEHGRWPMAPFARLLSLLWWGKARRWEAHRGARGCSSPDGCDPKMGLRCISLRLLTCGYVRHLLVVRIAQNAVDFSVFKGVGSQILGDRRLA